jgi:diguanylate cyclase (GGDEF)-like protein/PAS domain S-box-containing protein
MAGKNSILDIPDEFSDANLLFQAMMDNMSDSIYFKDRNFRLIRFSRQLLNNLGFSKPEELIGKTDVELFGQEFGDRTREEEIRVMETGQPIIGLVEGRDLESGKKNWTSTTKYPLRNKNGEIFGIMGITREINELKQVESDLQFLATHDVLTSLPNRYLLFDRMDQAIYRAQRHGHIMAVLFVDVDDFKDINDTYGHAAGDLILVQIAEQLKKNVRETDTVARIGGDEFIVLMESIQNEEEAVHVAERVVTDVHKGINIYPICPDVTVSVGISLYPKHGTTSNQLMGRADDAMYRAKINKNSFVLFS